MYHEGHVWFLRPCLPQTTECLLALPPLLYYYYYYFLTHFQPFLPTLFPHAGKRQRVMWPALGHQLVGPAKPVTLCACCSLPLSQGSRSLSSPDTRQLSDHVGRDPAVMSGGISLINPEVVRAGQTVLSQILTFLCQISLIAHFLPYKRMERGSLQLESYSVINMMLPWVNGTCPGPASAVCA